MIDYIDLSKCLYKDNPNFTYCNPFPCKLNMFGWQTFYLQGCKEIQVHWREDVKMLKVKGSLPYFLKGHNFTFSQQEYVESIGLIQSLLGVGLWDAGLNEFEYGVIMPVQMKPSLYIKNHSQLPKSKLKESVNGKDNGNLKKWECPDVCLKMYDAGANILMKQSLKARQVIEQSGYNPQLNWLKFEAHFKKPYKLNGGRNLYVEDLQNPQWVSNLNDILKQQYKLLKPMADLVKPTNKNDYSALDVVLIEYAKVLMDAGKPIQDVKKQLYSAINQAECLSESDKDARQRTIRKAFNRLQESNHSQWDIGDKIEEAIEATNKAHRGESVGLQSPM